MKDVHPPIEITDEWAAYSPDENKIQLDGWFTVEQLERLVEWIKTQSTNEGADTQESGK